MDSYEELLKAAELLKSVSVKGEYWMIMQACVNSILRVAEELKGGTKNAIDNTDKS